MLTLQIDPGRVLIVHCRGLHFVVTGKWDKKRRRVRLVFDAPPEVAVARSDLECGCGSGQAVTHYDERWRGECCR